jgi:hypothetical protein
MYGPDYERRTHLATTRGGTNPAFETNINQTNGQKRPTNALAKVPPTCCSLY